jgi:hypothetical protein
VTIWRAVIHCTLVVRDVVMVCCAEPWLRSHGELDLRIHLRFD